jgi:hypothetical protein
VRVLLSSQIPADFLKIQGFVALLDSVFVGRLDDEQAQEDALRLLKVPIGAGYEQVVASLGRRPGGDRGVTERDRAPRQFIFGDGNGGVERIRIDFSGPHLEHLRTALDTTPDALRDGAGRHRAGVTAAPDRPELPSGSGNRVADYAELPAEEVDDELREDFAELEAGLTDELVGAPGPRPDPDTPTGGGRPAREGR